MSHVIINYQINTGELKNVEKLVGSNNNNNTLFTFPLQGLSNLLNN